jgi:hypothetical protein
MYVCVHILIILVGSTDCTISGKPADAGLLVMKDQAGLALFFLHRSVIITIQLNDAFKFCFYYSMK